MLKFKSSLLAQCLVVTILGTSAVACSNSEKDTKEPAESSSVEVQTPSESVDKGATASEAPMNDNTPMTQEAPVTETAPPATTPATTGGSTDTTNPSAEASEGMNAEEPIGSENDAVIDGTEQEEHVSTY